MTLQLGSVLRLGIGPLGALQGAVCTRHGGLPGGGLRTKLNESNTLFSAPDLGMGSVWPRAAGCRAQGEVAVWFSLQ